MGVDIDMNEYEKIISAINSGLTGNAQHDHIYLLEQIEKYKQHPMFHEISKEIGRKLYEIFPRRKVQNAVYAEVHAKEFIRTLDKKIARHLLDIPLLDNFKMAETPQYFFSATDGAFMEQLSAYGPMKQNETFEQKINLVLKDELNFMKICSPANDENSIFYYKDYSNGIFDYKIYVQDLKIDIDNTTKIMRRFHAYFIEPRLNTFNQITISSPAVSMSTKTLKLGVVDLNTDQTTQNIDNLLKVVMDNLKYKSAHSSDNNETKITIKEV